MVDKVSNWFELYSDVLYDWAYHKTSKSEVAEDLVQDTFLSALQYVDSFKEESNPKTWLFAILNNKIIDYYKKEAKLSLVLENSVSKKSKLLTDSFFSKSGFWDSNYKHMSFENDSHLLDDEDFIKVLQLCLGHLPENWNKAVHFKYIVEKKPTEICQELDISMSNYWQVIHRAKLMLKKCIEINYYKIA